MNTDWEINQNPMKAIGLTRLMTAQIPSPRLGGERETMRLERVRPICATLEEPKAAIPPGALTRLNPGLLKRWNR